MDAHAQHDAIDDTGHSEWQLNSRDLVRVSIEQFKGQWLINIRKWYRAEDGTARPTSKGIALNIRHLPKLHEAIASALHAGQRRGLC